MGACKYCGQAAGLLKNKHKECEARYNDNINKMVELTREHIVENKDFQQLNSQLAQLSKSGFVPKNEIKQAVLHGWSNAVEAFLDDDILSSKEEASLKAFQSFFKLTDDELNFDGSYTQVVQAATNKMIELTRNHIVENKDFQQLKHQLDQLSTSGFVPKNEIKQAVLHGWSNAIEAFLDDGVLSPQEETTLEAFQSCFKLTDDELNYDGSYTQVVQAAALRDILDGNVPQRIKLADDLPFNLLKSEQVVWVFNDVDYYEEKKKTHYEGSHHGFSVRVAKGIYYRAGAFRGHPVETSQIVHLDSGVMGVTNKHIYFTGPRKSFRIKFEKVVSFTPYDDGIGLQKDAATAKPQIFVTGEGWFTYNLITNMAQM